jgi:hypothetical protein
MSETTKSTPTPKPAATKPAETPSTSDSATASDSTSTTTAKAEGGKSSRESIGGAGAVHYGYFSNVKTPQYRSGWDDIWTKGAKTKKKKSPRAKEPIVISLALDELSDELRKGLADIARARLKSSRINYDKSDQAGAITWRIECDVKR